MLPPGGEAPPLQAEPAPGGAAGSRRVPGCAEGWGEEEGKEREEEDEPPIKILGFACVLLGFFNKSGRGNCFMLESLSCARRHRAQRKENKQEELPVSRSESVSVAESEFGLRLGSALVRKYLLRACVQALVLNF